MHLEGLCRLEPGVEGVEDPALHQVDGADPALLQAPAPLPHLLLLDERLGLLQERQGLLLLPRLVQRPRRHQAAAQVLRVQPSTPHL